MGLLVISLYKVAGLYAVAYQVVSNLPGEIEDDVARDACVVYESDFSCEGLADACVFCSVLLGELEVTCSLSLEDEAGP